MLPRGVIGNAPSPPADRRQPWSKTGQPRRELGEGPSPSDHSLMDRALLFPVNDFMSEFSWHCRRLLERESRRLPVVLRMRRG